MKVCVCGMNQCKIKSVSEIIIKQGLGTESSLDLSKISSVNSKCRCSKVN